MRLVLADVAAIALVDDREVRRWIHVRHMLIYTLNHRLRPTVLTDVQLLFRCSNINKLHLQCCPSMRQGLCNGTESVRQSYLSTAACRCGGFAAVGPVGMRYRSMAAAAGAAAARRTAARRSGANASSVTLSADGGS